MPASKLTTIQFAITALVLLAALVLGGGQGTPGDASVQVASAVLIALVLWRHAGDADARLPRAAWLAVALLALPLLQMMPLPEALWAMPPARAELATELTTAGIEPAHRWTLLPTATERALLWLLPAVALFLAGLQMRATQRWWLVKAVAALAALSVVLGLAQIAGGAESALRFYTITNPSEAVGFFANRNHLASLLAVALPFVVVGTARWLSKRQDMDAGTVLGLLAGIGAVALLILGIAIARSRAGLLLGMLGLLGSLPIVLGLRTRRGTGRVLAVAVGLGLTLAVQFALFGILQRLERDPLEDARFQYFEVAAEVADLHAPLGTGLGGFRPAFEAEDPAPVASYVNQAHNDWAQVWLEGGWAGRTLLLGAIIALAASGWCAWRRQSIQSPGERALARTAWLALLLLALHSLGDYPLRTTALLAVAGLLAACIAAPPGQREKTALPGTPARRSLDPAFNS